MIELTELFLEDAVRQLTAIKAAVSNGNSDELRFFAHRFKGSAYTFGARRLAQLCDALETIGRSGSVEGADQILASLERAFEEVRLAVQTRPTNQLASADWSNQ
ncbi:MAG TPA: Hpt domain-containing protein [Blastocatellia bacterium]|nr:Hpt domain-containing protein [Blastocatellia bacterium]